MWGLPGGTVFMIFYLFVFAVGNLVVTSMLCNRKEKKEKGGIK